MAADEDRDLSSLPFDHLLFTGSGGYRSLSRHWPTRPATSPLCTPELGAAKAPAIVGPDFPVKTAAERILWVKMFNAGQICTNVDYMFLPKGVSIESRPPLPATVCRAASPDINGRDYTSIIDERAFTRLQATLEDARTKGAVLVNLAERQIPDAKRRKFAPHLVLNPTEDMIVMQREIFCPILPIKDVCGIKQEVADYINSHDRPLAIYPFTHNAELRDFYISRVMSGGVSVNEALLHVGQHDLPFGGVGSERHGSLPRRREGVQQLFSKIAPGLLPRPSLTDPNAISAALRRPRNERPADDDQLEDVMLDGSMSGASGHREEPMASMRGKLAARQIHLPKIRERGNHLRSSRRRSADGNGQRATSKTLKSGTKGLLVAVAD